MNDLLRAYGAFLGEGKAKYPTHAQVLDKMDAEARSYFQGALDEKVNPGYRADRYCSLITLGAQKISEIVGYIRTLDKILPKDTIQKELYDKLLEENKQQKTLIKMLVESRGPSQLNELLERSRTIGIKVDDYWVVAVCAVNLVEALMNKKLIDLGESTEGDFTQRLERVVSSIKRKENREIQRMLPESLYKGVRQKLDHASHKYRPTPAEADNIVKTVIGFLDELFPASTENSVKT